jgi:dipeptidyl aminopeptidase/acylaminoacyl peptidase
MTFRVPRIRLSLFATASALILAATLNAQSPAKPTLAPAPDTANPIQQPSRAAQPSGVALSPDGATVAWTLRGREDATLHLTQVADPTSTRLIQIPGATHCSVEAPIWSPDSATLAFLSDCSADGAKSSQEQIFLWSNASSDIKQLTHLTGDIAQPAWSPNGKSIAFLFVENATRHAGALDAMSPWSGVIGGDGVEIQRVDSVNIATGDTSWLTPAQLHVYEFDWAPSSHQIAFIAANPPGENTWWIAKLYTADITTKEANTSDQANKEVHVVFDPNITTTALHGLQIAVPRYSPDGKRIAFIGGLMSDQGSTGGDVWVVPTAGDNPTDITPNIDGTPSFFVWLNDNRIGIAEDRRGHIILPDYDVAKRSYIDGSVIDLGAVSISGGPIKDSISVSHPFKSFALVQSSYNLAPEIYVFAASSTGVVPTQITHLNVGLPANTHKVESIEWENEGFHVQGWLAYPKNYDPSKKYPMIVEVHGGPSASAGPRGSVQWAELGYFDFQPNPRGSFGQGEKFVQANRKDFGYGDLRDILTGIDAIEKKVSIDDHRIGLTGWSYGGFMSMFAETQTNRFRTIIAGAGISDWKSYYGENSIDQWMIPFFGASVYDDPAVYAKSSAIEYIKNAKTPMLIIVGDRDGECPAPQSFEMWHALRAEGVKTQLVVYPNEGHGFRNPEHIRDRTEREVRWFAENMPASKQH